MKSRQVTQYEQGLLRQLEDKSNPTLKNLCPGSDVDWSCWKRGPWAWNIERDTFDSTLFLAAPFEGREEYVNVNR